MIESLPLPGAGRTASRLRSLWALAATSPSDARLLEAHHDAVAILTEAGIAAPTDGRLAVWAADAASATTLERVGDGWRLDGEQRWCSGASWATHALVTTRAGDARLLVLVEMAHPGITVRPSRWESPTFSAVDTRDVAFAGVDLPDAAVVGSDGWYVDRGGFWLGAVGVAACWGGCAAGIVDLVRDRWRADPHAIAHLGAIDAMLWGMSAALDAAGDEIDAAPDDTAAAHRRALRVRHLVDVGVADVTTRLSRALGPAPLAFVPDLHTRLAETDLYRRQCHAERDLESLGRLSLEPE